MGTVTSTMDIARDLVALGAAEGTTVVAESQTLGRGRAGRTWQSPPGAGLYCSILLRPNIDAATFAPFSIAAGLAICGALDPLRTAGIELKWPNDLVVAGRKLAGLLVMSASTGTFVDTAIVGVGVNLRPAPGRPESAISLADIAAIQPAQRQDPLSSVTSAFTSAYRQILAGELDLALAEWPTRLAYLDQPVTIDDAGQVWTGIHRGIDSSGSLLLETESGLRRFHAGDLTRGPSPPPQDPNEHDPTSAA